MNGMGAASIALFSLLGIDATGQESPGKSINELIESLNDSSVKVREKSAEALSKREGAGIVPALRKRAEHEDDFHVRLALHYALAFHGNRDALNVLLDSMKNTGHLGVVYLEQVTGRSFAWEEDLWRKWVSEISEEDFKKLVARRRLSAEERDAGWNDFLAAVTCLQDEADRAKAARMFREVVRAYPRSDHAIGAEEIAGFLERMIDEDKAWKEPGDPTTLPLKDKLDYNLYHLRNVNCYQFSQPGICDVLADSGRNKASYNAAKELRALGEPAIPALLALLEDRRPMRSVGYWRDFAHQRTVLRYQDAAIQILNELMPAAFYNRTSTGAYFSNEAPELRREIIRNLNVWYREARDKTPVEQKWIALKTAKIYPALKLLRSLATEHGQTDKVLKELQKKYENEHWIFRPCIVELMAELGDRSKVAEILDQHRQHKYSERLITRPEDGTASLNAEDAAQRILEKYGTKEK